MTTEMTTLEETPGSSKADPVLVAHDVQRWFGGLQSVGVDHLEIETGLVTSLIGPNGAGKTTLFNLLSGFDIPNSGSVVFGGSDISRAKPHQRARAGMVRTFQLTRSMTRLTVLENAKLAAQHQVGERLWCAPISALWKRQEREIEERARAVLATFGLGRMVDEYAGTLSGGQRRLLELARALMLEPRLLMLDEPMGGVNPALRETIMDQLRSLAAQGTTVLIVEHDMDMVMGVSDWVVCMAQGKVIAEGRPATVANDGAVVEAYLGSGYGDPLEPSDVEGAQ
ncbi:ABC transporter ATP-binding protein [Nocardioides sp. LHD-245]|uniref:ABC transporter ATP-binding protein n=1 Tax=Nocardioides sp. LHD-245 TaxID=3051387 RepID=UPI0027E0630E|nr:ABC transporter ATP-binding protein [Nocardioides sp. LHD-245]